MTSTVNGFFDNFKILPQAVTGPFSNNPNHCPLWGMLPAFDATGTRPGQNRSPGTEGTWE